MCKPSSGPGREPSRRRNEGSEAAEPYPMGAVSVCAAWVTSGARCRLTPPTAGYEMKCPHEEIHGSVYAHARRHQRGDNLE